MNKYKILCRETIVYEYRVEAETIGDALANSGDWDVHDSWPDNFTQNDEILEISKIEDTNNPLLNKDQTQ